jgi:hypothetical protein
MQLASTLLEFQELPDEASCWAYLLQEQSNYKRDFGPITGAVGPSAHALSPELT